MPWWEQVPVKRSYSVALTQLHFDPYNPRYATEHGPPYENDAQIVESLYESSDLGELLQSISTSGYVDIEPLIVLGEDEKLIVLEGNRRLAALRVLTDPSLASTCKISPPPIAPGKESTFERVSVYRVEHRNEARDFIGFKHINGAHRWDSIAKARYAASWLDEERQKGESGLTLREIARRMGDRHSTLQRMVSGYYVLKQAEELRLFDVDDREQGKKFYFSHLYTALTRPGYRYYLGLDDEPRSAEPKTNPISEKHLPQLKQVLLWLYGSDSDQTPAVIRSQNPHVRQLGQVLEHPKARTIMLESHDLSRAYAQVDSPYRQFERHLVKLHGTSENCLKKVSAYTGQDVTLLEIAEETNKNVRSLLVVMRDATAEKAATND